MKVVGEMAPEDVPVWAMRVAAALAVKATVTATLAVTAAEVPAVTTGMVAVPWVIVGGQVRRRPLVVEEAAAKEETPVLA